MSLSWLSKCSAVIGSGHVVLTEASYTREQPSPSTKDALLLSPESTHSLFSLPTAPNTQLQGGPDLSTQFPFIIFQEWAPDPILAKEGDTLQSSGVFHHPQEKHEK